MNQIKSFIKVYAKTAAAFIAGVLGNLLVNLINGGVPWPQTSAEWVQLLVTSFGAAIAALIVPNKITQRQLDKDRNVIGGVVVPDAQIPPTVGTINSPVVPGEFQNPWRS